MTRLDQETFALVVLLFVALLFVVAGSRCVADELHRPARAQAQVAQ